MNAAQQVSLYFPVVSYHTLNIFFICNSTLGSEGKFIKLCKLNKSKINAVCGAGGWGEMQGKEEIQIQKIASGI